VDKDEEKATALYSQAAEKGDARANFILALCYKNGEGVDKDKSKAIEYFTKAADLGNEDAMNGLKTMGIAYTPCKTISEANEEEKEEAEEEVAGTENQGEADNHEESEGDKETSYIEVSCLVKSCTSDVDLLNMEDSFFPSSSPLFPDEEQGKKETQTRYLADALLQLLDRRGTEATICNNPSEEEELENAIANLFTVAAGMTSIEEDTHDRVQSAIDTLSHQLPELKKQSKQRQAALKAMRQMIEKGKKERQVALEAVREMVVKGNIERVGGHRKVGEGSEAEEQMEDSNPPALVRASVLSKLLQPECVDSPSCVRILRNIRERVSQSISKMKADMNKVDEISQRERQREPNREFDSAAYLIMISKAYAEKSKVVLPHLLNMSHQLDIDLLHLSGSDLDLLFDMGEMSTLKSEYERSLDLIRRCRSHIELKKNGEEAVAVRSSSGLASLLSGHVPSGMDNRPANVTLFATASHFARLRSSSACSAWYSSMTEAWSWLECKHSEWKDLEARSDHVLSHVDDVGELGRVANELKASGMEVHDRVAALVEKATSLMLDE